MDHWELRNLLFYQLERDASINYENMIKDNSQLNRRNYLRSLFAFYDFEVGNLRERLAKLIVDNSISSEEINFHLLSPLMESSVFITDGGKLKLRPNQHPFKNLIKFIINQWVDLTKIEINIFDNGWNEFLESVDIRNRITHPKFENEINISDDELITIEKGREWWNEMIKKVFNM